MNSKELYEALANHEGDARFSWFKHERHGYPPFIFNLMTGKDRALLYQWYTETQEQWPYGDGASGFTTMSTVAGFLLGSGIRSMVQCGHYVGFSTIVLGLVFRYMGIKNAMYSMDVHETAHEYTLKWVQRFGLGNYVHCVLRDSSDPANIVDARQYFSGSIESVFIDSAHTYSHTVKEINIWWKEISPGGFMFLHDVSDIAKSYDVDNRGGVKLALLEHLDEFSCQAMLINSKWKNGSIYTDPCGLGILQRPLGSSLV
ncbi:class I SAM-dependent methyltransferase [Oceanibaculum pacificum]|uniref:class I SAM-dependent methyltransferase n=1 Tax=Oceanibaculum pacificum TaxID=580166 RepID=UPI0009FCABC8|nr:class I SAM-dependent methyltransferase [Oceanibaculum pacificum]